MEVAGIVCRQVPCFSSNTGTADASNFHSFSTVRSLCVQRKPNWKSLAEFSDNSHIQYYNYNYNYKNGPMMAIKEKETTSKKKEMKKKLKLLKGLSKNLSTFSDMGFGLNPDNGLDDQVKGQMISEATEVLLGQLQKLKAEKLETKRKKKEEKAKKKGGVMMMMDCKDSSESSSCSSESECEKVVDLRQLKSVATEHEEATSSIVPVEEKRSMNMIEVCMGGKCKKSGAAVVLESLEKAVGGEAAVVSCKCMGKCRDGPNVKVVSNGNGHGNGNGSGNGGLCMGVGLQDIDSIVTNLFGGSRRCSAAYGLSSGV